MSDLPRPPRTGQDPPFARHLHLVSRTPEKPKRKGRKRVFQADIFTPEESLRLRAALKAARWAFGSVGCLAAALDASRDTIAAAASGRIPFSAALAVRLARAIGKPLESLYRAPTAANVCPHCGARRVP